MFLVGVVPMEGIIQYRLLGSHPEASGRYLTLGFPGESTTVQRVLDHLIQEHRINMSRYKLEVTRMITEPPGSSSGGGEAQGQRQQPPQPSAADANAAAVLRGPDVLRTYDRIVVTVSKRVLADETVSAAEREEQERQARLQEAVRQMTDAGLPVSSSGVLGSSAGSGRPGGQRQPPGGGGNRGQQRGGPSPSAGGQKQSDPRALERVAAVANKALPVRRGKSSGLHALTDAENDHVCVLCDLSTYDEMLTPCCHFVVCAGCYHSAEAMTMTEGECPVCGKLHSLSPTSSTASPTSPSGEQERKLPSRHGISPTTQGVKKKEEGRSVGGGAQSVRDDVLDRKTARAGDDRDSSMLPPEVLSFETELRDNLDQVLTLLDARDPLTAEVKAKRVKSDALTSFEANA